GIYQALDYPSLVTYLQLNYIPAPHTIFGYVRKLMPGQCISLRNKELRVTNWYSIPFDAARARGSVESYDEAKKKFALLLEEAVKRRLVADVPLGAFLSGGKIGRASCREGA